jgi:hypothetical protein
LGHPEPQRTILALPIAKISFKKMKFDFDYGGTGVPARPLGVIAIKRRAITPTAPLKDQKRNLYFS